MTTQPNGCWFMSSQPHCTDSVCTHCVNLKKSLITCIIRHHLFYCHSLEGMIWKVKFQRKLRTNGSSAEFQIKLPWFYSSLGITCQDLISLFFVVVVFLYLCL